LGCRTCVALTHVPHYCSGGYGIALGCRTCVALTRVPDYCSPGFDVRLYFHASPSLGSSYVYGTGNGTLAVKGRGCQEVSLARTSDEQLPVGAATRASSSGRT
jgi:hypothetical protein